MEAGTRRTAAAAVALLLAGGTPEAHATPRAPAPELTVHPVAAVPQLVAAAPDGEVWYVHGRRLGRMTPAGAVTDLGDLPAGPEPARAGGLAAGPDGGVWLADCASLQLLGANGAARRTVRLPEATCATAVAAGAAGEAWFAAASPDGGNLGRVTADGTLTLLALRPDGMVPRSLAYGPSGRGGGNTVWFLETSPDGQAITRLDPSHPADPQAARRTVLPSDGCPGPVAAGPDGAAWFPKLCGPAALGRVGADGTATSLPLADPARRPVAVAGGADGALWYRTEGGLGRLLPHGADTAVPVPERADLGAGGPLVAGADVVWLAAADSANPGGGLLGRVRSEAARDRTPPRISCPAPPARWSAANVAVRCAAADPGGLAAAADASFVLRTDVPLGTETAAAATGTRRVCDRSGNCASVGPLRGIRIDRRPPAVALRSPADDERYGLASRRPADYACIDRGSGLAACSGTVADGEPVPTRATGRHSFVVEATDRAGNIRRVTHLYQVGLVRGRHVATSVEKSGERDQLDLFR